MAYNLTKALDLYFAREGELTTAADGTLRRFGISAKLASIVLKRDVTEEELKELPREECCNILRFQYWDACRCGELPAGLDYAVFDAATVCTPSIAAECLQRILGVGVDGQVGALTIDAAHMQAQRDEEGLIGLFIGRVLAYLWTQSTWSTNGRFWTYRYTGCDEHNELPLQLGVKGEALLLAQNDALYAMPVPQHIPEATVKAPPEDVSTIRTTDGQLTTAVTGGGLLAGVLQLIGFVTPYASTLKFAQYVVIGLVVVAAVFLFLQKRAEIKNYGSL